MSRNIFQNTAHIIHLKFYFCEINMFLVENLQNTEKQNFYVISISFSRKVITKLYAPGNILSTLHMLTHLILKISRR